jgi:hypothetical protein
MAIRFRFDDLFNTAKLNDRDATSLRYIYENVNGPLTEAIAANFPAGENTTSDLDQNLYQLTGNTLIADTIAHFASNEVLFAIDGMLEKFEVPTSVQGKFQSYYVKMIEGNKDSLLPANMDFLPKYKEFPVAADELAKLLLQFFSYFAELRKLLFEKTLEIMESTARDTAKRITESMSEIFQFVCDKPDADFDTLTEFCKATFKRNNSPDMYDAFAVVIGLFDTYRFNYKLFSEFAYMKVRDLDYDNLELQRKYLLSNLRKDANYDKSRKHINSIIDMYRSKMDKIERHIKEEEKRIRNIYSVNNSTDLQSLVDELIVSQN